MSDQLKHQRYLRRQHRTRATIGENLERPRLSVFKSHRHIYAQIIDDQQGKTLAAAHDMQITGKTKTARAEEVGQAVALLAKTQKVIKVRFDRGAYKYHGRVAALANAARSAGLEF